jgi:hypothetical protein
VLRHPEPGVTQPLCRDRPLHGVPQSSPLRLAGAGAGTVEQREPHTPANRQCPWRLPVHPRTRTTSTARRRPRDGQPIKRRAVLIGCCTHHRATRRPRRHRSAHSGGRAAPGRGHGGTRLDGRGLPRQQQVSRGPPSSAPERGERQDRRASADSSSSVVPCPMQPDASRWGPSGRPGSGSVSTPRHSPTGTASGGTAPHRGARCGFTPSGISVARPWRPGVEGPPTW